MSLRKRDIMKLFITTLTMIFISFGANSTIKIGQLHDYCSIYKSNNFKVKGLVGDNFSKALFCVNKIQSFIEAGWQTCKTYNLFYKKSVEKNQISKSDKQLYYLMSLTTANKFITTKQGVLSFLNWADKNPKLFDKYPFVYLGDYLINDFPCEIKGLKAQF